MGQIIVTIVLSAPLCALYGDRCERHQGNSRRNELITSSTI